VHCANCQSVETQRRQRLQNRRNTHITQPVYRSRLIPIIELLNEPALQRIEQQADWLLETIGMEFRGDGVALELFREAGARVNGCSVTFEPGLARSLCSTAPNCVTLVSRNPKHTIHIGANNLVFMPGYGSPFVNDLDQGRRYAKLEDFKNFVRLTHLSPHLHHAGGVICEPMDVPVNKRHLDMTLAHLTLTDKPFMGSVTSVQQARDALAMARLVFGRRFLSGDASILKRPCRDASQYQHKFAVCVR